MSSLSANLEAYYLIRNPFDPAPLEASERDMGLFVGRNDEINQIQTILASVPDGLYRVVVMGAYGVGKTSFVNRIFWEAQNHDKWKFATIKLIAKEDMTFLEFLLSLIDKSVDILRREDLSRDQQKTVEEIKLNLDFERQIGTETKSEITGTLNAVIASLAGKLGVSESEIRKPHPWTERSGLKDLDAIITLVLEYYNGIILGIDEVDYLASRKAMEVLRKGREEIFQRRNFLFVFSGSLRFRTLLDKIGSPIREIIDKFMILEAFRYPEERSILHELMDLRLKSAAKDGIKYRNPFDKESMDLVFTLSGGVPRRILRFLQISMDTALASSKSATTTTVLRAVRELGKGHYVGLPLRERHIIKLLARRESIKHEDFEEVRKKFKLSEEAERKIRSRLESQGLLYTNFVGNETIHSLAPELRVYVLHESKLATPVLQIEAAQKLKQTIPDEKDAKARKTQMKYASLLEGQGHLGLLKVEYEQMSKEERLGHCEKATSCIQGLSDSKLSPVVKNISNIIKSIKNSVSNKTVKEFVEKAEKGLKDYAHSVFEPGRDGLGQVVFRYPRHDREVIFKMDASVNFKDFVLHDALLRDAALKNREIFVHWVRASKKEKTRKPKHRSKFRSLLDRVYRKRKAPS